MSFYGLIKSYDIHTYWNNNHDREREEANLLRTKLQTEFAHEIEAGNIHLYKMWDKPIGPHPISMFEIDFKDPALFGRLVQFYQLNHGRLSVLIHPRTGDDLKDHTVHALWLGHKVRLNTDLLSN